MRDNGWSGTDQPGERVCDVLVDGNTVLDDYDIVADVGHQTGVMKAFRRHRRRQHRHRLRLSPQNQLINTIEIISFS